VKSFIERQQLGWRLLIVFGMFVTGTLSVIVHDITEEFIDLLSKFPKWIYNMEEWRDWFNEKDFTEV